MKHEGNPVHWNRDIRLGRAQEAIFKTQLRALLRASVLGNLQIMFPMVSSIEELRWAKHMVQECREELLGEGIEIKPDIPLGMMIEIPSTAVMAEIFAQ